MRRGRGIGLAVGWWLWALLAVGCGPDAAPVGRGGEVVAAAEAPELDVTLAFDGRVEAANATDLFAPQNVFRIAGWNSSSSWTKIVELVPEGTAVKEGEMVARFEFSGTRALSMITERGQGADAEADKSALELEEELRRLVVERDKLDLDAERAGLDTLKASSISGRQQALFQIQYEEATFEAEAIRRQIGALRARMRSEAAFYDEQKARAAYDLELYTRYQERFVVRAPHDGVVRHAYFKHRRRKVEKGDGMPAGMHVISVARDETVQVRFYVPEGRLDSVAVGQRFHARPVASDQDFGVVVDRILMFPQEVGFLREDENLPNAREKAYGVVARFEAAGVDLGAGTEVRVTP